MSASQEEDKLGISPATHLWVDAGFLLESVCGWYTQETFDDEECITIHLVGGQTMTVDFTYDEFVAILEAHSEDGTVFDETN